jgi:hypothetical protein
MQPEPARHPQLTDAGEEQEQHPRQERDQAEQAEAAPSRLPTVVAALTIEACPRSE